jgi:hypothetical protein
VCVHIILGHKNGSAGKKCLPPRLTTSPLTSCSCKLSFDLREREGERERERRVRDRQTGRQIDVIKIFFKIQFGRQISK